MNLYVQDFLKKSEVDVCRHFADRKRKPGSQPDIAVNVGNVTVKLYKRQRITANGKYKRAIYEVANYTNGCAACAG
ncbi:MAG TPA: hypothetical protein VG938_06725 [Verrucomicrobiae bacterium]|jgi:hypothetical protein|nr:hypothetical protein [Verrucomicrobiae bacterium]